MITKKQYWYAIDIYCCVLCGKEEKFKQRVYDEKEKGILYHGGAFICWSHF